MTGQFRLGLAAAILLVFSALSPNLARGQRTAPNSGVRAPAAPVHARPVAPHVIVSRARSSQSLAGSGRVAGFRAPATSFALGSGTLFSLQDLLNPVPGLGFDYAHLAAINRDLGIKAVIDPATQWRLAVAERVLRDTGGLAPTGGFFLLDGGVTYVVPVEAASPQPPQQQPQIIVLQQAPATAQPSPQPTPAVVPEAAAPLPDVGSFTLILRNGTKIQTVAFTRMNDRIVYITADGIRRTMALSDLDSEATMRINEERGTPVRLPL